MGEGKDVQKAKYLDRSRNKIYYGIKFSRYLLGNMWYLAKKLKFREAFKYFMALNFTEEGARLFDPIFRKHPELAARPMRIELETTTVCPLKCLKCEHTYWKEKQVNMTFEQFKHVVDQFPWLTAISLSGIGHCTENPEFIQMVEYCKKKALHVQFFDPFLKIDEKMARKLIEMRVNRIHVSLDGATAKTVNTYQAGNNFDLVMKNLKTMMRLKEELNSPFPEIDFHFIVNKFNYHEMPEYLDLINSIIRGTQGMTFIQYTRLIPFKENLFLMPDIPQEILNETRIKVSNYPKFLVYLFNVPPKKLPIKCCAAWTVPFITVDGHVYACCSLTENNQRQLNNSISMGNLFKNSFAEVWSSPKFKDLRTKINAGQVPEWCNRTRPCPLFETGECTRHLQ